MIWLRTNRGDTETRTRSTPHHGVTLHVEKVWIRSDGFDSLAFRVYGSLNLGPGRTVTLPVTISGMPRSFDEACKLVDENAEWWAERFLDEIARLAALMLAGM
jgi:hypothetical protein